MIFRYFFLFIILFFSFIKLSLAEELYYIDSDDNGKIDQLNLVLDNEIFGELNLDKIFLYSNTGGLSNNIIDGENIFTFYKIEGNILKLYFEEQDLYKDKLNISNTTSSDLRLKTNSGNGIFIGEEELKLRYTSSFYNYENVYYKDNNKLNNIENTTPDLLEDSIENEINNSEDSEILEDEVIDNVTSNIGEFLNIIPTFQSPSYLINLDLGLDEYTCDNSKEICKVNFDLKQNDISLGSEYSCIWQTTFETDVDLGKCNINKLEIPEGENIITYNIYKNNEFYTNNSIKIINNGYDENISFSNNTSKDILDTIRIIKIKKPEIEIQSGLDKDFICKNELCRVNFIHHKLNDKFECEWIFNNAIYKNTDLYKCNPGYINFLSGNSGVYLKVYQKNFPSNFSMTYITVKNNVKDENIIDKEAIDENNLEIKKLDDIEEIVENTDEKIENKILEQPKKIKKVSYFGSLQIAEVLPNPKGKDLYEYIKIINLNSEKLSLSGCYLKELSTKKKFMLDDYFIEGNLKIYQYESNIHLNNTKGFNLELNCFNELIDNFVWEYKSIDDFLIDREIMGKKIDEINLENDEFSLVGNNLSLKKKYIVNNPLLDLKTKKISKEEKLDLANDIINDNFSQKLEINNKGFTAYGKTLPGIKITMSLNKIEKNSYLGIGKIYADNIFSTISDNLGNYKIVVNYPLVGEYEIKNYVEISDDYAIKLEEENTLKIDSTKNIVEEKEVNLDEITINLQTKSTKYNEIYPNKIVCLNGDCSINFIASNNKKDLEYLWDFGDGESHIGYNPSFHKYGVGTYIISLEIKSGEKSSTKYFVVEVKGKKIQKEETSENNVKEIIQEKQNLVESKNNIITLKQNNFFSKELILTILIFLNFLLLSFLVLKNKKMI